MNKKSAIYISNILDMYVEEYGHEAFENKYGSEGQFLQDEIGMSMEDLDKYTEHMMGGKSD